MVMGWTDERRELAKALWTEGRSAAEIAKRLGGGLSRNAVIGVIHRAGLSGRGAPSRPGRIVHKAPRPAPRSRPRARAAPAAPKPRLLICGDGAVVEAAEAQPSPYVARRDAWLPLDGSSPVIWTSRAWNACAWPVGPGEGADTHSCALATVSDGASYCSVHAQLAYQPPQAKKKASATELRARCGGIYEPRPRVPASRT
jgi:GcrA cell cycle regulator